MNSSYGKSQTKKEHSFLSDSESNNDEEDPFGYKDRNK